MKKRLTYLLFILNAYLGYSQPSSWGKVQYTDSSAAVSIKSNFLTINGTPYIFEVGDAIAIFAKRIDSSYECVGYTVISSKDTLYRVIAFAKTGASTYGFLPGTAAMIMVYDKKNDCQLAIYTTDMPSGLRANMNIQIKTGTSNKVSLAYPDSIYYRTAANPLPYVSTQLSDFKVTYSFQSGLAGDSLTGEIFLTNSKSGLVKFQSNYCLATVSWPINILNTPIIDTSSKLSISKLTYTLTYPTCTKAGGLILHTDSIKGKAPFRYLLTHAASQEQWANNTGLFEQLPEGVYQLQVTDVLDSIVRFPSNIPLLKVGDCGNPVLTPDGKNGLETIYIEAQGTARILDREGKTVKEMTVPSIWDGSDNSGKTVPMGDYYLFVNNHQYKIITVIR